MSNYHKAKIRCSRIADIMTKSRNKGEISETAKAYMEELFILNVFGRDKQIINKYIAKGLGVEEEAITMLSKLYKRLYIKNTERFENELLTGEPDIVDMDNGRIKCIIDVKSSWDIFTHLKNCRKLNPDYYWQMQGYMALTGANKSIVAFCLINTPDPLVNDERRRLMWKMGVISDEDYVFKEAEEELLKNLIFDDVPENFRVKIWEVERNDEDINNIYEAATAALCYYDFLIQEYERNINQPGYVLEKK